VTAHSELAKGFGVNIWFANPCARCHSESIESTNGLLRQSVSKSLSLQRSASLVQLSHIANLLNRSLTRISEATQLPRPWLLK
jgi:IS30 family transposase